MFIGFLAVLVLATAIPAFAAKLPASKTAEQEMLEEKEAQEQAVTMDESVQAPLGVTVENLPEDTTPRFMLSRIVFSGNTLFGDEQLLEDIPDIYNASTAEVVEADLLYDLRPVKSIAAEPGMTQEVSARSIQGFTQYLLSIYQKQQHLRKSVSIPQYMEMS